MQMIQKISLISALAENLVIGINNRLPWKMPADWENFRKVTKDKSFIMGKKSYLAQDKLLSSNRNLILAHTPDFELCSNCIMVKSVAEALTTLKNEDEIFILGGASIFSQTIHLANYMYLTIIHSEFEGDAYFPEYDERHWQVKRSDFHYKDVTNPYDYTFLELERITKDIDDSYSRGIY
ncbi:dihydrofolate reductase [Bacteroidota bacterium]